MKGLGLHKPLKLPLLASVDTLPTCQYVSTTVISSSLRYRKSRLNLVHHTIHAQPSNTSAGPGSHGARDDKDDRNSMPDNPVTLDMAGITVVFDFDKTIVDVDSDNWVVDELGFTDMFNELLPTMPWNSLMDRMMFELHSHGKSIEDIVQVLKRIPIHPRIVPAIKAAHALGCDLRIVSDANIFFIETILENLGISEYFSEINTNPGYVNEEGRLRIFPYHDFNKAPHGCSLCPPNMCKGLVTERIQDSISCEENKRIIYLGDGSGDYCPSLRLKDRDFMMPRKNFPVWDLICKDPSIIKAEVHEWSDGEELERVLLRLINAISREETAQYISSDCKLQTMSVSAHEPLPHPLPVQQ